MGCITALFGVIIVYRVVEATQGEGGTIMRPAGGAASAWWVLMWLVGLPMIPAWASLLPPPAMLAVNGVGFALAYPTLLVRFVFVPLGMHRAAYVWGWTRLFVYQRDLRGGAALAAAQALVRRGRARPAELAWVEARLLRGVPGGASVVARGLLAQVGGDRDRARRLLARAPLLPAEVTPRDAARVAKDWLVLDAAARGDWEGCLVQAQASPYTRRGRFFAEAANAFDRLLIPRAAEELRLRMGWLIAPDRRRTLPLLRRALEQRRRKRGPAPGPRESGTPLESALRSHVRATSGTPTQAQVRDALARWDAALRALDPATADGVGVAARADLLEAAAGAGLDVAELAADLGASEAGYAIVDDLRERLERTANATGFWVADTAAPKGPAAFEVWMALADAYEDLIAAGGDDERLDAFVTLARPLNRVACKLVDVRDTKPLARAMFEYGLREARILDDEEWLDIFGHNTGLAIR